MSSCSDFCVYVLAFDSLEWVLAWRQIGVRRIRLVLLGKSAVESWARLVSEFGGYLGGVEVIDPVDMVAGFHCRGVATPCVSYVVRSACEAASAAHCIEGVAGIRVMAVSVTRGPKERWLGATLGSQSWTKRRMSHGKLGGLTGATLWMCWAFVGVSGASEVSVGGDGTRRSLVKFLEPSARLSSWMRSAARVPGPIWDTTQGEDSLRPAPWPLSPALFLRTYSVLLKEAVFRPVSDKEWAQLMDLRPEWGCLLRPVYQEWRDEGSTSVPLRFCVELGLAVTGLQPQTVAVMSESNEMNHYGRQLAHHLVRGDSTHSAQDKIKYLGWHWEPEDTQFVGVATTADDAEAKYHLWAVGGNGPGMEEARNGLRRLLWHWWIRRVRREMIEWLRSHDDPVNREGIRDCLRRLANSSWFDWLDGSRTHFWRWPERWLVEARDGAVPWVFEHPPRRLVWPTVRPAHEWMEDMEADKLAKLIRRRYIETGYVRVVIPRLIVLKGELDIRVVWDMTKNGVNGGIFASTFFLLGIYGLNLRLHAGQFVGDFDCGEMFNNYTLHESQRPVFGVHLSASMLEKLRSRDDLQDMDIQEFMRWGRLPFGWCPAPVFAIRMMMRSIEMAKGHPADRTSAFCFEQVVLNLPTMEDYDPGLPRVYKVRFDGLTACEVFVFVDDGRVAAATEELEERAMRQIVSRIQARGTQDAPRKREPASQRPRAWTGGVTHTDKGLLRKFLIPKKWKKMKTFVQAVCDAAREFDRKEFESGLGFLVHCSATYTFLRPYLVGFYLAMNRFRGNRDLDGWKMPMEKEGDGGDAVVEDKEESVVEDQEEMDGYFEVQMARRERRDGEGLEPEMIFRWDDTPETTKSVPITDLLRRNAGTITRLLEGDEPLQLLVRPISGSDNVGYAGSDASGEGYGVRDWFPDVKGEFVYGYWNKSTDDTSSNWREMKAALDKLRRDAKRGRLVGREVWFFTDNSTLERAFYKGYSSSLELYRMVEELWALSLSGGFLIHVVHVAGTRMIETGIDGLSRGEIELGLLQRSLRDSVPLAQSPIERCGDLRGWLSDWLGVEEQDLQVATPMDWHYNAHQSDAVTLDAESETWIWDLPPAAALYALEELACARTKRLDLLRGVVLVPGLMTPEWYRRFSKTVDVFFRVPAGTAGVWPSHMHEPLTVGIFLPTFSVQPWDWKNVTWMGKLGRTLSGLYKTDPARAGNFLSQFWETAISVPGMPPRLVRNLLSRETWMPLCGYSSRRR